MTQVAFHSKIIRDVASDMMPSVYVGLGICDGGTFKEVMPYAKSLYGCDIAGRCRANTFPGDPKTHFFQMTTSEFADVWRNEIMLEIDMILIDACHSKDSVIEDFKNFYPFLKKDYGVMFLHDTWPETIEKTCETECGTAYLAKEEISRSFDNIEMMTIPCQHGLTMIRKVGDDWRNGVVK